MESIKKDRERKIVEDILSIMTIPVQFGGNPDYNDYSMLDGIGEKIRDYIDEKELECPFSTDSGVSKGVIIFEKLGIVIKIPYVGLYERATDCSNCGWENCETCPLTEEDLEDDFIPFDNADDIYELKRYSNWDYCENELVKYEKAREEGFVDFFPKTEFYGLVDGHPVYLQEKVKSFYAGLEDRPPSRVARESYENSRRVQSAPISEEWLLQAIDFYGLERLESFLVFIEKEGLDDDLHDGNIGFNYQNAPILLDWAGWRY